MVSGNGKSGNGHARASEAKDIIYDWNSLNKKAPMARRPVAFVDETLRDGIQSPSVTDPTIEQKIELLHLMEDIGVGVLDVGLPAAGPRAFNDCVRLVEEIRDRKMKIIPSCAARTVVNDIRPIVDIVQKTGVPVECYSFIGSSPVRQFAEGWDLDTMLRHTEAAIQFSVKHGLTTVYVTEDTTRSHPATLDKMFRHAINNGVSRLCLCDTVGHATPDGVFNLINFTRNLISTTGAEIGIDWHGHNDRGLSVTLALHAIEAGATRIHGTGLGVGERVGNAPLDQILLNLKLLGELDHDLTKLVEYCEAVSRYCKVPIPYNYPLAGKDAFRTGTGVHAAAIIKALRKGDRELADKVYSGVPAGWFGKEQVIEIGHYSGMSNVTFWLEKHGIAHDEKLCQDILNLAKSGNRLLTDDEIMQVVQQHSRQTPVSA
ncbi:MAG: 2-isopropylmalate synthase [Myxococcota bacterium]|nr:2-isopropylmalate synthase [Myxococcota bacterium]